MDDAFRSLLVPRRSTLARVREIIESPRGPITKDTRLAEQAAAVFGYVSLLLADGSVEYIQNVQAIAVEPLPGFSGNGEQTKKVAHDGRQHVGQDDNPTTGKFVPMPHEPKYVKVPGVPIPVAINDTREGIPWSLDGGKGAPSGGGDSESGHSAYDPNGDAGEGDPQGLRARTVRWLFG